MAAGLCFAVFNAWAQHEEGSLAGYYRPPFDTELLPSANFAETRVNHLHSGVDIKTGGAEGRKVYAAAEGYVCRIGIAPGGFGRVLYVNHPNGTTTVYAHLQKFTPAMEKYVTGERYRQKKHNIDLYLGPQTFPVNKGDLIGYSGNSGRSSGPHLHYELRDAATQRPLNLLVRGALDIKDDIPLTIVRLHYVEVDTVDNVPLNSKPRAIEVKKISANLFSPADTSAVELGPRGYFILEATDRKNGTANTMGIYRVDAAFDGEPLFGFSLDGFLYSDTRYVNSLCHYAMQRNSRNQMLRLALQANNRLPVYTKMQNRGLVSLSDDRPHLVNIKVTDDNGNISTMEIRVKKRSAQRTFYSTSDIAGRVADYTREFRSSLGGMTVTIPARALYESVFFKEAMDENLVLKGGGTASDRRYSPVYTIHDNAIPLHKAMTISIKPEGLPESLYSKACLAVVSNDGTYSYAGGKYENGSVTGTSTLFGRYCVVADNIAPVATPSFADGADLKGRSSISFTVKDNFSGIASFNATIDGVWIILEQNTMKNTITHYFDPDKVAYTGGKHELSLTVTDNKGNSTVVKRSFIR